MRNSLAHGYFKVDLRIVWTTMASDDRPDLARQLRARLDELRPPDEDARPEE